MSIELASLAENAPEAAPALIDARAAFDHSIWNRLLHEYVDDQGLVAYQRLQEHDRDALYSYLQQMATADPAAWKETERLAFWINAYNSMIVAAVLEGQSAESLLGRGKIFKFWKFPIAGKERTLDEVEHEILRKEFAEPRIHFAIVCASRSCPRLRTEAYSADELEAQLDDQARRFINDPSRNELDMNHSLLRLSKIFDWFRSDFEREGTLLEFLARYVETPPLRLWLEKNPPRVEIQYLDYDWTLNAQPEQRPREQKRPVIREGEPR
ncbi:MAG: DUF547 domain-containing protein [Candidatus Eisenbacteria bacterium]